MKVKVLSLNEKDDFAKQYFFPSDFFTIGKEYTVLCMDFSNKDENYNNIFEQQFCYRYSVINDNGDKAYVFPENTEITDYSFPSFWEKGIEGDKHKHHFIGPKGWGPQFWDDFNEGNCNVKIKFYLEYQKLYNEKIFVADIPSKMKYMLSKYYPNGTNSVCTYKWKKSYLEPTNEKNSFFFRIEGDGFFDESRFALTKDKNYFISEFRGWNDDWYKVKNDNNEELYYPRFVFDYIKKE
jgi:hypothetical protein